MRALSLAIIIPILFGCASNPPRLPKTVEVVVERYRPLPEWATEQRAVPALESSTVEGHLKRENRLEGEAELSNCHRQLLKQLDENKVVNPRDCDPEK
jgi:hypothetical protein